MCTLPNVIVVLSAVSRFPLSDCQAAHGSVSLEQSHSVDAMHAMLTPGSVLAGAARRPHV